jgi:hypothetical protein
MAVTVIKKERGPEENVPDRITFLCRLLRQGIEINVRQSEFFFIHPDRMKNHLTVQP